MKKAIITKQILTGQLTMPRIAKLEGICTTIEYKTITRMFEAAFKSYIRKGAHLTSKGQMSCAISMPYWAKQISNPRVHNIALKVLSDSKWFTVNTRPNANWSEAYINEAKLLEYVTQAQLDQVRLHNKFLGYRLEDHNADDARNFGATLTKVKGEVKSTGLVRNGFAAAGKVPFRFDTAAIAQYEIVVKDAINKGITNMIAKYPTIAQDHANYRELGSEVVDFYATSDLTYMAGPRTSDPRGRDNAGYLDKIGNPVGFKVMRSLLVIPEEHRNLATKAGLYNKFMFIAQLLGFKSGSKWDKIAAGRTAYLASTYHECDYSESTAEEIFENIWLERTYADIDNRFNLNPVAKSIIKKRGSFRALLTHVVPYKWEVPIEIDMSASVLGYLGLLLNHKPFLDRCNITMGSLTDAWAHDVVTNRKQFKTIMRQCYGSQMSAADMWKDMKIPYTEDEVDAFNHEMKEGDIAVAIAFKDFCINNCNMAPEMQFHIGNESFTTFCNRFHNVGERTFVFDLYNTSTASIRTIHNTETMQVPDLHSFKRYSVTGLIHNLDGQVMDAAAEATIAKYGWLLPIHDAAIVCCEAASYTRKVYAEGVTPDSPSLKWVHTNRASLLQNYFRSINVPASAIIEWKKVLKLVQPLEEELIVNPMVLK